MPGPLQAHSKGEGGGGTSRAVFVDRDGTINPDLHYLREAERLEVYAGVAEGIRLLKAHGYRVVCVTNQSGIGRGLYTEEDVARIHARANEILEREGTRIDRFYHCPHRPEDGCDCRKPGTALFQRARRDLDLEFGTSAIIGDRRIDIEAGERLGLLTVLVPSRGHGREVREEIGSLERPPDLIAPSFRAAAIRLLHRG